MNYSIVTKIKFLILALFTFMSCIFSNVNFVSASSNINYMYTTKNGEANLNGGDGSVVIQSNQGQSLVGKYFIDI